MCVLVPDDVIPSLPLAAVPTGARSWPAATPSRSTGSWSTAISGWSRPACSVRRSAAATRRASGSSRPSGSTAISPARARRACSASRGDRRPAPGRDRAQRTPGSVARPRRRAGALARVDGSERRLREHHARSRHPDRGDDHRTGAVGRGRAHLPPPPRSRLRGAVRVPFADEPVRTAVAPGRYDHLDFGSIMRELTDDIASGRFADEWDAERDAGYPTCAS